MTKDQILTNLSSKKTSERKKAALEISKQKLSEFGQILYNSFLEEVKDSRTWETQYEMLIALGLIQYKKALPTVFEIVKQNKPHSMISYAAAQTYVRLARNSKDDAKPIINLLKTGSLSIVDGALTPLAYDKMKPNESEIISLIHLGWNLHKHRDRIGKENGYTDPRYGLAAACAGWNTELTIDFLKHCLSSAGNDTSLKYVAQNSIKQKYSKLR